MKVDSMKHTIFISGLLSNYVVEQLAKNKEFEVIYKPDCKYSYLIKNMSNVSVLITRSETKVDQALMDKSPQLKVVARAAVGVSNIDIDYATRRGILVINTPGKNTNSAAEHTMALLLGMFRNIPQAHESLKAGKWNRHAFMGKELLEKRIGIVGLGNVGHRVAKFAKGFDMEVYGYDPYVSPELFVRYGIKPFYSLQEMASQVEILSLHVPLNKQTKGMIDREILSSMSPQSYILNVARGGVVCEEALLEALNSNLLGGAAIDTWYQEPKPNPDLINHPKVWCSPHIGASTREAQEKIGKSIVEQVKRALSGNIVSFPVNLPKVGVLDSPLVKPYSVLSEKIGSLTAQLLDFNPSRMEILYRGDLAHLDQSLIKLGFMKGYVSKISSEYVSYVNAEEHFSRLGIGIEESHDQDFQSYKSALKVRIFDSSGKSLSLGGIVFDHKHIKISLVNDYYFEVKPNGTMIIIENEDRLGVVGIIGNFLAKHHVNIESFDLSRKKAGEKAMAFIKVDSSIEQSQLKELINHPDICSARIIHL